MAEEALGKTVKQLKQERTSAKAAFSRQADYLSHALGSMAKLELQEEFSKLGSLARQVSHANEDYRTGLPADLEAEIAKTAAECERRLDEVQKAAQEEMWARYGETKIGSRFTEAEAACDRAQGNPMCSKHLEQVTRLVQEASASLAEWEPWIPPEKMAHLKGREATLRSVSDNLEAREAEFLSAQRFAAGETGEKEPQPAVVQQEMVPQPLIRLEPISLPKFTGSKRDFYRWRNDWESLHRLGEPSASAEVKKYQLLDSVDEKICGDLQLSPYRSTDDIFRVLQNRFGNKHSITMEIIEDLERIPRLKLNQPRRVINLIQSVEQALCDLTEIRNTGAIKNPLMVRCIESKLPEDLLKDWFRFERKPSNQVTLGNHFDILLKFLKGEKDILVKLEQFREEEEFLYKDCKKSRMRHLRR